MRTKRAVSTPELSLLPGLKEEEARLRVALEAARAQAEKLVLDAARRAEEAVRAARGDLPGRMAEERERLRAIAEAEARSLRLPLGEIERRVADLAAGNLPATVAYIVSAVLPESGS